MNFSPLQIREDFPIYRHFSTLKEPFIYLDNAATTQKPEAVITAEMEYYQSYCANVHRSPHKLGEMATERLEEARRITARFLGNVSADQIIFTRGTTESINIISHIFADQLLRPGDVILLTPSEHHSNLVPWQMAAQRTGAILEFTDINSDGTLNTESIRSNWNPMTKVFAFQYASNVTGAIHDARSLVQIAHDNGALTLVDGAQAAPHFPIDLTEIDCDFFAFSGHKTVGPTGIGVLFGKKESLERFTPVFGGGEMILKVGRYSSTYNDVPYKYEPGTPNIAGAIGLGAALTYLIEVGLDKISLYCDELAQYACAKLKEVPELTLIGPMSHRTGAISFNIAGCHPHDIASILDSKGIAIRAGVHCAEPLMECLGVASTARASFYFYNTIDEVDLLVEGLLATRKVLGL